MVIMSAFAVGLVAFGLLVCVLFYGVMVYNSLVKYRVETDNAWSQIDVQLKRRHDLIPNLVETVKGVMKFEQETLTKVMQARAAAMGAGTQADRMKAENEITGFMGRLLAVWEQYPDLKASKNALQLQEELTTTENQIAYSRGYYNDVTANYNTQIQQFPSNIIAGMFRFIAREFFKAPESETAVPKVQF
jgi:LemA protein